MWKKIKENKLGTPSNTDGEVWTAACLTPYLWSQWTMAVNGGDSGR